MKASTNNPHFLGFAPRLLLALLVCVLTVWLWRLTTAGHMPSVGLTTAAPATPARPKAENTVSSPVLPAQTGLTVRGASAAPQARAAMRDQVAPPVPLVRAEGAGSTGLSEGDRDFIERVALSCVEEDEISRGALVHLVYPEVRQYAYLLLHDHAAAVAELKDLAERKGMVFPVADNTAYKKWRKTEGSVDQGYLDLMAEDNEAVLKLFEKAARSDDAEIATFARRTVPLFQNHLKTARDLKKVTE